MTVGTILAVSALVLAVAIGLVAYLERRAERLEQERHDAWQARIDREAAFVERRRIRGLGAKEKAWPKY